jgi:hypothetical protein
VLTENFVVGKLDNGAHGLEVVINFTLLRALYIENLPDTWFLRNSRSTPHGQISRRSLFSAENSAFPWNTRFFALFVVYTSVCGDRCGVARSYVCVRSCFSSPPPFLREIHGVSNYAVGGVGGVLVSTSRAEGRKCRTTTRRLKKLSFVYFQNSIHLRV